MIIKKFNLISDNSLLLKLQISNKLKKLPAFTLAEVLIVLLIIGIVASLTIPAVIQNTKNAEFKTAFIKSLAEVSQLADRIRMDNGGTLVGVFKDDDRANAMITLKPYFAQMKYCPPGDYSCWAADNGEANALILKNGALVAIPGPAWVNSNCTNKVEDSACMGLAVDVNGNKGPNEAGKDVFFIKLLANRTVPVGGQGDNYENDCGPSTGNVGCAGWVIQNKDY